MCAALAAVLGAGVLAPGAGGEQASSQRLAREAGALDAGNGHTCGVVGDATVRCWGRNAFGGLGDGNSPEDSDTPVPVEGLTGAVAVSADEHSCAVLRDGSARCWGINRNGQLGDGNRGDDSDTPVAVQGLAGAVAISAGGAHSCALISDGSARCWGSNFLGQLGDGNRGAASDTPVVVQGLAGAVAISAGNRQTCAVIADGTARCWGDNANGQLGDGNSPQDSDTPVPVAGLTGAVAISAGGSHDDHTCALISDGTARCWGANFDGQLGDGNSPEGSDTPVSVQGLTGAVAISAGGNHSCALIGDGSARCWGSNGFGELGDGSTQSADTPVAVRGFGAGGNLLMWVIPRLDRAFPYRFRLIARLGVTPQSRVAECRGTATFAFVFAGRLRALRTRALRLTAAGTCFALIDVTLPRRLSLLIIRRPGVFVLRSLARFNGNARLTPWLSNSVLYGAA